MYSESCALATPAARPELAIAPSLRAPAPELSEIDRTAPTIRVALPDGGQAHLPGFLWPNTDIWNLSDRASGGPVPISIRQVNRKESNPLVRAWHDLGEETRLFSYTAFVLYVLAEPVAVATAGTTVSASVDQSFGLNRLNTIELTRICRSDTPRAKGVLRAMLRLWRDFLAVPYWSWRTDVEKRALVTYSLPGKKGGDLYRFDGWVRLRACRPWHGGGTWQTGSRVGTPEALWAYWLPEAAGQ